MPNFNRGRINRGQNKPKGKQKVGQTGRPRVGQKKVFPKVENLQELVRQKSELGKQWRGLLEQIKKSGKAWGDQENLPLWAEIGALVRKISRIDGKIRGSKTQGPRYGRRSNKKG